MIRRPPRSTLSSSSAASDVYKRQENCTLHIAEPGNSQAQAAAQGDSRKGKHRTTSAHGQLASGRNGFTGNLSLIHISEPTRLLSISYAVFCLKKKKKQSTRTS
eukprot:TRINITY_DN40076_c0_g1_i1.p1 TRINITY_DN40076_c0_g1~~TRINITY_DN40076_c0_g1_i1.p1  ORF type:complete len:104 (-),score=25.56 TRINITY_DN40076_c0_g1_i1:58-369(-)